MTLRAILPVATLMAIISRVTAIAGRWRFRDLGRLFVATFTRCSPMRPL